MKKFFFFLLMVSFSIAKAQNNGIDSMSIDVVFEACAAMQESLEKNDTTALLEAASKLRNSKATSFTSLRCKDDTIHSMNGHFVFNDVFVDSLAAGNDAYSNADKINRATIHRGQTANGSILTKTCFVKAGKSTRYTFASRGKQELGIIAEPGGKLYVRVHVTNRYGLDVRYNDDKNAVNGTRLYRKSFNLPMNQRNTVELEVINKGSKDTSFVVISN